ncbi:MAG: hypothetical protein U1D55_07210 [Phycisphaerae bacterium]
MHFARSHFASLSAVFAISLAASASAQQEADPAFDAKVAKPAYKTGDGPIVLFDEGHHNFHTSGGRYKPFADLITSDGYRVRPVKAKFTEESLKDGVILVIANALGAERMNDPAAHEPAFSNHECEVVDDWVKHGGNLLLITDHFPTGSAAELLGRQFHVEMSCGATNDEPTFTRENKRLGKHVILEGRSAEERVNTIKTFTGQTLKAPEGATALLTMSDDARERIPNPDDPRRGKPREASAAGRSQCVVLTHGKGRVVILGEAAMLTAQVHGDEKFGMNVPGLDNRQFALNIMHWLSGALK